MATPRCRVLCHPVHQLQCKVLCVGLDNSGKSTVIQHLKPDKKVCGPPRPARSPPVPRRTPAHRRGRGIRAWYDMRAPGSQRGAAPRACCSHPRRLALPALRWRRESLPLVAAPLRRGAAHGEEGAGASAGGVFCGLGSGHCAPGCARAAGSGGAAGAIIAR